MKTCWSGRWRNTWIGNESDYIFDHDESDCLAGSGGHVTF
jgi:hypothetical protein